MKVEFEDGYAVGFKMAVGECFRDSIAKERFNAGDIIYNDKRAYLSPWSLAIEHVAYAFQVIQMVGENIEYTVLLRNKQSHSLAKDRLIKESIQDFINKLKTGL